MLKIVAIAEKGVITADFAERACGTAKSFFAAYKTMPGVHCVALYRPDGGLHEIWQRPPPPAPVEMIFVGTVSERVMAFLRKLGSHTVPEIKETLSLNENTLRRTLSDLIRAKKVERIGHNYVATPPRTRKASHHGR